MTPHYAFRSNPSGLGKAGPCRSKITTSRCGIVCLRACLVCLILFLGLYPPLAANASPGPSDGSMQARSGSSWFIDMGKYQQSAHSDLDCVKCHYQIRDSDRQHPDFSDPDFLKQNSITSFDYTACRECHPKAYARYNQGLHARAREEQERTASPQQKLEDTPPTCGHCHNVHTQVSNMSRLKLGKTQIENCGPCHREFEQSYKKNTHGKIGVNLENDEAAYCSDCHGAHKVISLNDEQQNLKACRRCHPQAEASFADAFIHSTSPALKLLGKENEDLRWKTNFVSVVRTLVIIVVVLFIIFFAVHSVLSYIREAHEKLRKK